LAVRAGCCGNRRFLQRVKRVHFAHRALHDNLIIDAVDRVQPLVWIGLSGTGERDEHVTGDITLGEAELLGTIAIDVHLDRRVLDLLMDMGVHNTGNGDNLAEQMLGDSVVVFWITTDDLEVDGSGQAKIQNLVGHVSGREEEGFFGKFLSELLSQQAGVLQGAPFARRERNLDVAVGIANSGGIGKCEIEAAVRQTNVIENHVDAALREKLANLIFDGGEDTLRFFDAGSGGRQDMQTHLAGIYVGEKVAANGRDQ